MNTREPDRPETQRIYRFWVEIRDLCDGSSRTLPLQALQLIHLTAKRGTSPRPDEQVLRLQDDGGVIEAKDVVELAAKLRSRYPDETYERRLHWERDLGAEQRRSDALQSLVQLLAEAALEDLLRDQAGEAPKPTSAWTGASGRRLRLEDPVLIQPRDPVAHDRREPTHRLDDDPRLEPFLLKHPPVVVEDHRPLAIRIRRVPHLRTHHHQGQVEPVAELERLLPRTRGREERAHLEVLFPRVRTRDQRDVVPDAAIPSS